MAKTKITAETIAKAMDAPAVRAALRARAERILPRAQRNAYGAGAKAFGDELHVEEGTRPGAKSKDGVRRPYARISADVTDTMKDADAGAKLTRISILRRSAGA